MTTGLAARLWAANADLAERILAHGFVRGLADGTLPLESFRRYVAQDAWFLEAFARAYAHCLAASKERADVYRFAALIAGVIEELKLHGAYAERWSVALDGVVPAAATRDYTQFLLNVASAGDIGATAAAMTPCMRLYAFLGQRLAQGPVAERYSEWVRTYASPDFESLAATLETVLDSHATESPAVRDNYRKAMQLELAFFAANL
jgi:thiaminase/transcriptional activator TenA